jgi:hypothetical protein
MGFASAWLEKGTVFPEFIKEAPHNDTGIIVVIPSYDETGIIRLLNSLAECSKPGCRTEVIININAPEEASRESLLNNKITQESINIWEKGNTKHFFRLYFFNTGQPSIKKWGVGLARKSLMDEALRRFDFINQPDGVIANLDADCTVQENYFLSLENDLLKKPTRKACSIYFEHPIEGNEFTSEIYNSIVQYELHLRYYHYALRYCGFPYYFHTVGSSIAIKSLPYLQAGGMNRLQAGEDFYFIQKLMPLGGYFSMNSTTVYPSPRKSGRVPYGTGVVVSKMVDNREMCFMSYNPMAFQDLKALFNRIEEAFYTDEAGNRKLFLTFPQSVKSFIKEDDWVNRLCEIRANTSKISTFRKRFFEWFNMFMVVKFLNNYHRFNMNKIPVEEAAIRLLDLTGVDPIPIGAISLLMYFRDKERFS